MNISDEQIEALYRQAFPEVAKVIGRMGGDAEIAKDLFHDALILFLQKHREGNMKLSGSPVGYLVGICRFLWYRHLRSDRLELNQRSDDHLQNLVSEVGGSDDDETIYLHEHLKRTGEKCLDLLTAYYYDEKSLEEIAGMLNYRNTRSATVQKYKCIEKLRSQMTKAIMHEKAA